jgi:hypothetical protein
VVEQLGPALRTALKSAAAPRPDAGR